jgi:hypothetical protein
LIPTTDLVFYALGSGEYDEMACEWRGDSSSRQQGPGGHLHSDEQRQSGVADGFACNMPARLVRDQHTILMRCASSAGNPLLLLPLLLVCALCAVSGVLRVIMIAIADVVGKPPTESVFFEKYSRIACVIDEVLNEVRVSVWVVGWVQCAGVGSVCGQGVGRW